MEGNVNRVNSKQILKKVIYCFVLNLLVLFLFLVFYSLSYEMPDNLAYAQFIAEGDYTFDYMGYLICAFIGIIQKIIYPINAFIVFHLLFSYISFVIITFVFVDKFKNFIGTLFSVLLLSFYAVSHYGNVSFTRDPALFCCAGFLLILHYSSKHCVTPLIIGVLMIVIGSMYRFLVFEVCVLITAVYIFADSVSSFLSVKKQSVVLKRFSPFF